MSRNQKINTKFDTSSKQSGEVTALLSEISEPSAIEAYNRIQALEANAVSAATAQQAAKNVADEAAAERDVIRKHVTMLNAACVNICGIQGVVSAEYFTIVDRGDAAGLARRLEPEIRRVPNYGPPLADALVLLLRDLTAADVVSQNAESALVTAQRELDAAILNLQGSVAQGRAVLATFGVRLKRKVAKKKTLTLVPPAVVPPALVPAAVG